MASDYLENPFGIFSGRFCLLNWLLNHATNHTQDRCTQAEKKATTRSSTFYFARASQNKKSFHFPTTTRK